MTLLTKAKNHDPDAMLKLLHYFEPEMLRHSRYISMPQEDALQHMRLVLIELFHTTDLPFHDNDE
ncbi:helix-turn-helix domain-containing protein [Paenibacillus sp. OK076]|uniref:helix-turn-helix domain-containing protein n=1 Tax=Paenibacillus sp. OK076 TaxID=1884379 RepID=UPI00210E36ED|nr:helix-turn-helix domain-containing protein [Paenibacillus sp. OK076]